MQALTYDPLFYLNHLNSSQREAVEHEAGPLLVLAGAGTGKTRVLTTRVAHLIRQGMVYPSHILAVTFTNKAAQEMRQRVAEVLGQAVDGLWLGTFHSLCVRILRRHAELVGLTPRFTILDSDDQLRLIKQILQEEGKGAHSIEPRVLLALISRWKDKGIEPNQQIQDHLTPLYLLYQERLRTLDAVDFGDLLLYCIRLFREHPFVLEQYQNQFRAILVDEYQDTNVAQYTWLRLLAAREPVHLFCVGDDDQSIYGWRGAEVSHILKFEQDFPGARIIRLEQNYRSTPPILAAASGLIAHNKGRLGKTLWTEEKEGEKVVVRATWDALEEARFIGEEVEALQRQGAELSSIAILVRAGFQTREFEDRFLTMGLPYRVIGGMRFYERLEIRDALAYLRLVVHPNDGLAFERIINTPKRGIGQATIQKIHQEARDQDLPLPEAARRLGEAQAIKGKAQATLQAFFEDLDRWHSLLLKGEDVPKLAKRVLEESGYIEFWRQDRSPEAQGRLENLKEFVQALGEFDTLEGFLDHVSLVMDRVQDQADDLLTIMTLHAAKGLEFNTVFLTGWEENLFPHARSLEENGQGGLEEERRLAYVGLTRARKKAFITFAHHRRTYQGWQLALPSRFIKELPTDHVTFLNPNGLEVEVFQTPQERTHSSFMGGRALPARVSSPPARASFSFQKQPIASFLEARVYHKLFGYGTVLQQDGDSLTIQFDTFEVKKVKASFVEAIETSKN